MYSMSGDVVELPVGGVIRKKNSAVTQQAEMQRLNQLGDILGMSPLEVRAVQQDLASQAFRQQVRGREGFVCLCVCVEGRTLCVVRFWWLVLVQVARSRVFVLPALCFPAPSFTLLDSSILFMLLHSADCLPAAPPLPQTPKHTHNHHHHHQATDVLRGSGTLTGERKQYLDNLAQQLSMPEEEKDKIIREVRPHSF